jgi:hypothetical protein
MREAARAEPGPSRAERDGAPRLQPRLAGRGGGGQQVIGGAPMKPATKRVAG